MKITFVQNAAEQKVADRVILNGLSLKRAKVGTWILPPAHSRDGKFTVIDSPTGKDVFAESFGTLDGALMYALGIKSDVEKKDDPVLGWDRHDALKDWGNFS
jgi:hypothetical protein